MSIVELLNERRPHRVDAARNFDAIVAAARERFSEAGVSASLEDIARRAGVGVATLYRNFPTRGALLEAVYVAEVAAVCEYGNQVGDLSPWEALEAWLRRFVEYLGTKRALIEGLSRESETFLACRQALYDTGEPLHTRAQAAGEVRPDLDIDDVLRLAFALTAGVYRTDEQRTRITTIALEGVKSTRA
jgi:AcrR family transcriptional regulator